MVEGNINKKRIRFSSTSCNE